MEYFGQQNRPWKLLQVGMFVPNLKRICQQLQLQKVYNEYEKT